MGQVTGVTAQQSNNLFGMQDPNTWMGFAMMSALLSNDPRQIAGALSTLAQMDPRQFLMMLSAMNPDLFNQLAASLMGQPVGGGSQCSCGAQQPQQAQNQFGGIPLSEMVMNNLLGNRSRGGGGDAHVVPPRNRGRSFQRNGNEPQRAPAERNTPAQAPRGSTDGTAVHGAQVYRPNSPEAIALFRDAARLAGVPESWASSPALHKILARESGGVVGRPNYTYGSRANDRSQWGNIHNELRSGRITARSSATGLGQLLLSNVDRYYPAGRAGIGNPVQEAAGMLAYIKSRYGSPEVAWARYNTRHEGY